MNNEENQTEMINGLISRIKNEMILGDFKDLNELVDYIADKAENVAYDSSNWGYTQAENIANDIKVRVRRLKNLKKAHQIPNRVKDIIESIKY